MVITMRSFGFLTLILVVTALFSIPQVSASDNLLLTTRDVVTVLSGEQLVDSIEVINEAPLNFTVVVYTGYTVEGLSDTLMNFTPGYTFFRNWRAGESQTFSFNVSVSSNVTPGFYTLVLRFRGMAEDGSLHDLILRVPLRVSDNPVVLKSLDLSVLQRPSSPSPNPFNGETLVLRAVISNIGNTPTGFVYWVNVTSLATGDVVYSTHGNSVISPGEVKIEARIPVGWDWEPGEYNVSFFVSSLRGSESLWRIVHVSTGVNYINVSMSRESVPLGGDIKAYITVLSERKLDTNLTVSVWSEETLLMSRTLPVSLQPGTQVLELGFPTNVSGELRFVMKLNYGEILLAQANGTYRVLGYPVIESIKQEFNGSILRLNIILTNPNDVPMKARLIYNMSSAEVLLYSDSKDMLLKPGTTVKTFEFQLPWNSTVEYSFVLVGEGKTFDTESGVVNVPPKPVSTESTSSLSTTSSASGEEGYGSREYLIILSIVVIVAILLVGIILGSKEEKGYVSPWERARKPRTRPKPKRRSPLGRFKRPKLPKFIENRELPRRFKRKPVTKVKKKKS
ncbi:hypothetical protein X802_05530 [Thermococcus guaymasensis DSM 11113]|uniref:CARDB domain-containing protein n=2 Tax=Thermococcus guaymasensis TaxID=110164 RepID=A0A0X1KK92_9EURY|nr:hypothetical protein X802_05530 [Thermococcus guaymasensis DSM 11113]